MTATDRFVTTLSGLKPGALGLLRAQEGRGLDEAVDAFDLFTGLWWPLRESSPAAPRREVAWLAAKLFARCPLPHVPGKTLAAQVARCQPRDDRGRTRFRSRFDRLLGLSLGEIEPALQWALGLAEATGQGLDWTQLIDDLSRWERESIRLSWAQQFLHGDERSE